MLVNARDVKNVPGRQDRPVDRTIGLVSAGVRARTGSAG